MSDPGEPSGTGWPPSFDDDRWSVLAFVVAFALWVVVSNVFLVGLLGDGVVSERLVGAVSSTVQVGIVLVLLRREGVALRDLGLARDRLLPAALALTGVLVGLNVVVAGMVLLRGESLSVGLYPLYRSGPDGYSTVAVVLSGAYFYLFVGPAEELAFRGYLQNKLVVLFGGRRDRTLTAAAIVAAAAVFALLHVPAILVVGDVGVAAVAGGLLLLTLSGVAFGTVYVATRNLYFVAVLHGFGDWWPLFVDPGSVGWPNWGVVVVVYGVVVVLYRRWTVTASSSAPGVAAGD